VEQTLDIWESVSGSVPQPSVHDSTLHSSAPSLTPQTYAFYNRYELNRIEQEQRQPHQDQVLTGGTGRIRVRSVGERRIEGSKDRRIEGSKGWRK
jgi:hypothetical protein